MAGHDDELRVFVDLFDGCQQLDAVHVRHTDIAEHNFVPRAVEFLQRVLSIFGQSDLMPLAAENLSDQLAN
jgi:hypothetical protein